MHMERLSTEYTPISPPEDENRKTSASDNRRTKLFAIIALLVVSACAAMYVPHASGTFDMRVFVSRAPKQPMSGFFASEVDEEICIQLKRKNLKFQSIGLFGLAPDFIRSVRGRLSGDNEADNSIAFEYVSKSDFFQDCTLNATVNDFTFTCEDKTTLRYFRVPSCHVRTQKRIKVDLDVVNQIKISPAMKNGLEGVWDFYFDGIAKVFVGSATIAHDEGNGNSFRILWHGMLSELFQTCESKFTRKSGGILFARMYGHSVDFHWQLLGQNRMRTENPDFSRIGMIGIRRQEKNDL